eukprot:TRINITY_DN229_c0_g1_i2.p3 TRINITY_DN229_c0_g1~~TRINITY_DN229_c0_g1_i2.p3  ORF type:complete len:73 (+),score=40.54 TRINITY_DN229_c0_g1_i2:350-568(+)
MDMALDPASALEKEIRASSLWVEEELKQMARNLLFNLRQDSIKKQVVTAWEKKKKKYRLRGRSSETAKAHRG